MNSPLINVLRNIASDFGQLAEELEKQNENVDQRITYIETIVNDNREALKDAANAILGRIG